MNVAKLTLPASTILEVSIALVILASVVSASLMIYHNVVTSGPSYRAIEAQAQLDEIWHQLQRTPEWRSREYRREHLTITQQINPYPGPADLYQVVLTARDVQGQLVSTQQHLWYVPH